MAHGHVKPEKSNPFAYWPILLIGISLVGYIFVSGLMRGSYSAKTTNRVPAAQPVKKDAVNVRALAEPTKELIALGRQKYQVNCASCHGAEGFGDGDKGRALNPPPRNFHQAEKWTQGRSVLDLWVTLEKGIPGTSMSSYQLLPAEDRMAMIHYLSQWVPEQPEMTSDMIAQLPGGGDTGGGAQPMQAVESGDRIPIELAMRKLAELAPRPVQATSSKVPAGQAGAEIFAAHCATCHGGHGEGGKAVEVLTTAPFVRLSAPALVGADGAWTSDADAFRGIVTESRTGKAWHGFGALSDEEVEMLHDFCRGLSGGSW